MKRRLATAFTLVATHANAAWWDIFRKSEPEPVPEPATTVLGMEPLTALVLLVAALALALTIYYKPRTFMRAFTESIAWTFGIMIAGGLVIAVGVIYLEALGGAALILLVVLAVIGFLALMGAGGDI